MWLSDNEWKTKSRSKCLHCSCVNVCKGVVDVFRCCAIVTVTLVTRRSESWCHCCAQDVPKASCPLLSCFVVRPLKKKRKIPTEFTNCRRAEVRWKDRGSRQTCFWNFFFKQLSCKLRVIWHPDSSSTEWTDTRSKTKAKRTTVEHQRSLEKNLDNGVNRSTTPTQLDSTLIPMETGHCGGFKQEARVSAKKIFGARNVITRWKKNQNKNM